MSTYYKSVPAIKIWPDTPLPDKQNDLLKNLWATYLKDKLDPGVGGGWTYKQGVSKEDTFMALLLIRLVLPKNFCLDVGAVVCPATPSTPTWIVKGDEINVIYSAVLDFSAEDFTVSGESYAALKEAAKKKLLDYEFSTKSQVGELVFPAQSDVTYKSLENALASDKALSFAQIYGSLPSGDQTIKLVKVEEKGSSSKEDPFGAITNLKNENAELKEKLKEALKNAAPHPVKATKTGKAKKAVVPENEKRQYILTVSKSIEPQKFSEGIKMAIMGVEDITIVG